MIVFIFFILKVENCKKMHWMIDRFCLFFIFENWKLQKVVLSYLSVGIGVLTGKAKVEHVDPSHRLQRFLLSKICSALTFIMPWSEIFPLKYRTCMLKFKLFCLQFYIPWFTWGVLPTAKLLGFTSLMVTRSGLSSKLSW